MCGRFQVPSCCGERCEDGTGTLVHTMTACYRRDPPGTGGTAREPINVDDQVARRIHGYLPDGVPPSAGTCGSPWPPPRAEAYCPRCGRSLALHTYRPVGDLFDRVCPR
jgi:hypothetical protein